ncbi:hypothetical protein BBK36DRAFT_1172427 [Trichoderma citrinoviride]|uniref:Peptidase S8/S53 domain-containing protein n=1 Tax=Trichoderma citrinoviride TaxID=58853 RepID=A0A2T4B032_9HYPO|nr:hypothetical protein BBK36DRAFT_1172427 [Trichoderma citrinoviride]PTB62672.1 hypothetical protein BBK36DRAFT_1172427 [Trichoderma citrinoviride]
MHASRIARQQQNDSVPGGGRESTESTEEIRRALLEDIKTAVEKEQSINQIPSFDARLKQCIFDAKERHQTLLHWIVVQVESQHKHADDADHFKQAANTMVQEAMKFNAKLISRVDQASNTALHHALSSNDERVESLISTMCTYQENKEYLREAISHRNNSLKNCLHLAIDHKNEDIADEIISIADEAAFCQGRNFETTKIGQALSDTGNTPLHDAVKYDRGIIEKPMCTKYTDGEPCESCQNAMVDFKYKVSNAPSLITKLIERCNKALKIKNGNDESPYLYYMRTKADYELAKKDKSPVKESQGFTTCQVTLSNEVASRMQSILIESAFAIGSFADACACFFGDKADEDGKSSPLRPGYPIMKNAYSKYKLLIPENTAVLSHVDLQIGRSGSRTNTAPSQAQVGGNSRTNTPQEAEPSNEDNEDQSTQWKNDMQSLRKIFAMLRDRGVKRILKVTIRDNEKRPSSDQVIQECLAGFDVRYLNWTKPDLSASVICASCPKIAELTLYSSGRRAVLDSWAASTGLSRLRQLTHINLYASPGLENYDVYLTMMRSFQTELFENIEIARRKLVLVSTLEMCKLEIQDLKGCMLESSEDPAYLEDCREELEKARQKEQSCQEGLRLLEVEKGTLENQRLDKLLETWNSGGNKSATADAILQDNEREKRSPQDRNEVRIPSNTQGLDAGTGKVGVANGKSTEVPGLMGTPGKMHREWHYNNPYDGPPTKESKLFSPIPEVENCANGSFVSLTFTMDIFLTASPSSDEANILTVPRANGTLIQISPALEQNRWLTAVENFVKKRVQPTPNESQAKVKVALIDDGIDYRQIDHSLHQPGWPYMKADSEDKPWYHSENGHGTLMAKMIFKMCPRAQLFVAKLGGYDNLRKPDNADKAADAIAWAIKHEVDVISMSWSLVASDSNKDGIAKLKTRIEEAAKANILLYCAAADKGPFAEKGTVFPHSRSKPDIRIIGSAKETGGESQFIDPTQVHYMFPGENIPELGDTKGSSVATALAAGFAALILWCFKYKNESADTVEQIANPNGMDNIFQKLVQPPSKWVNVTRLLGVDNPLSVEEVIKRCKGSVEW